MSYAGAAPSSSRYGKLMNPGRMNPGRGIAWRGMRNGNEVQFSIPTGGVLEIVDVKENPIGEKIYICEITVDGIKYTNVKINKIFTEGDNAWFDFSYQGGTRRKRTRRNRRKSTYRRR